MHHPQTSTMYLPKWLNVVLLSSMFLTQILSETVFHGAQIFFELLTVATLAFLFTKIKFSSSVWILLSVGAVLLIANFLALPLGRGVIVSKNQILAILSYLVLSQFKLRLSFIPIVAFSCAVLVILERYYFDRFPLKIEDYLVNSYWLIESRPLGLFLAEHTSAMFIATFFFGYTLFRRSYFLDVFALYSTNVASAFLSLVGAYLARVIRLQTFVANLPVTFVILFIVAFWWLLYGLHGPFINFLEVYFPDTYSSGLTIFKQLFDVSYLASQMPLLPGNLTTLSENEVVLEIGLFRYAVELGGGFTAVLLYLVMKHLPSWRIFLLLTMVHYSFAHIPLFIYTMLYFQHRLNDVADAKSSHNGPENT